MRRHFSVVSWNIENLEPLLGLPPVRRRQALKSAKETRRTALIDLLEALGSPEVLCLQEIRIRPGDTGAVDAMQRALPGYRCHASLARDPRNAAFRGGRAYGVVTYVREQHAALVVTPPGWDREGRLVTVQLANVALTIANVYAVNGTDRPHFDHELDRVDGDRHGFKRRFQAELLQYLRVVRGDHELLLVGDWNVSRAAIDIYPRLRTEGPHALARAMFNDTFMPGLDVVDAFRELHPEQRAYTWFNRRAPPGKLDAARVDFALVSRGLRERVRDASILDEPRWLQYSDHVPTRVLLELGCPDEAAGSQLASREA